jgi:hypothetical protein
MVDSTPQTPQSLVALLGPPTKIIPRRIRPGPRNVLDYRYFVLNHSGQVQDRSYFFDGKTLVTSSRSDLAWEKGYAFKVLNYQLPKDRRRIDEYIKKNPYLAD